MNCFIIGTRAEYIKTFPVMLEMQKRKIPYLFMHTGQHDLSELCKTFGTKEPDVIITEPPKKTSRFFANVPKAIGWSAGIVFKIRKEVNKIQGLEYVFYHGDTITTAVAAIATSRLLNPGKKYKNVHLEAGLRSDDLFEPFPEEISRKIADRFSDVLLAVSKRAANNLRREKVKGKIIVVGNTIVDSAPIALKKAKKIKLPKKFALATIHRHENIKSRGRMEKIIEILEAVPLPCMLSLHDNTKKQLEKMGLLLRITGNKNITVMGNKNYSDFIYLLSKSSLLLTDGGSIQEESLIFKKPCILLRCATERQEGLGTPLNYLSGLEVKAAKDKMAQFLKGNYSESFENPYGNNVSEKIIYALNLKHAARLRSTVK